jgi:hypothetical protein
MRRVGRQDFDSRLFSIDADTNGGKPKIARPSTKARKKDPLFRGLFVSAWSLTSAVTAATRREAIATINWLIAPRLERNFSHLTALTARGLEHLAAAARSAAGAEARAAARTALSLARLAAFGAAIRLIREAFAREELLLAGTENELAVTIDAAQGLIGIHVRSSLPGVRCP